MEDMTQLLQLQPNVHSAHLNLSLTAAVLGQQFVRKNFVDFWRESEVRAAGLVQQSTGKKLQKGCHMWWYDGGGKEVTEQRPFSEGNEGRNQSMFWFA